MATEPSGTLLRTSTGKPFAQFTIGPNKKRAGAVLEHVRNDREAIAKKEAIGAFVDRLRDEGHTRCLRNLIREACAADADGIARVQKLAERILAGKEAGLAGGGAIAKEGLTVEKLAELWTGGDLAARYPDHVRPRKHPDRDEALFGVLNAIRMPDGAKFGTAAIATMTIDDLDHVMANLPATARSALTRRNYARAIGRLLSLAVFPLRLRASTPIPPGWTPKGRASKAKSWIYPSEDLALMRCADGDRGVPLARRILWGVLAREGLRASEALRLTWQDLDLEHGIIRLDENKTDEARSWALGADVAAGLAAWKKIRGDKAKKNPKVFPLALIGWQGASAARHLAELLRDDLKSAGVKRAELHKSTGPNRLRLRAHDLRGTFVTLALAAGKSEAWVTDRTGHKSSTMIYTYKRASRTAAELDLGWFEPLDEAIPELASGGRSGPRGRANEEQTRGARGRETSRRGSNSPRKRHIASAQESSGQFENRRGCKPSKSSNPFSSANQNLRTLFCVVTGARVFGVSASCAARRSFSNRARFVATSRCS
jgi:integrase